MTDSLLRFLIWFTKVLAWLTVGGLVLLSIVVVATLISPEPIFLRTPVSLVGVGGEGLSLAFPLDEPQVPSQALTFAILAAIPGAAAKALIMFQLHKILLTVQAKNPFVSENVRHLRVIAFALFVIPLFVTLAGVFHGQWRYELINVPGVEVATRWQIDSTGIGTGGLLLLLAEVFRLGIAMKEEQDLTV